MSAKPPRYLCIHGHFYQPPRENPWLEVVEVQDSSAPDHDWNARITRECYAPNGRSRIVDSQMRILHLLNNYAWMSFNYGPTLLAWMEEQRPEVLHGIVEGDQLSRERRRGHGNALAQVFNHMIMPLASPRDKRTQVRWGIADFRRRFGREPEGMWLAETGVDLASLEALADAGIRFTILAPGQAKRWRKIGTTEWAAIPGGIDPSRAYLCRLPSGRSISLFFYDGVISRMVAFEGLLANGEKFLAGLMNGFDDRRTHAQMVHIATDGESYGHHHPHGDMALAFVLDRLSRDKDVRLTNYGEFLELHPPEWEVELHDKSSWSCAHGVERWRSNCGCNMGRGWQQEWRQPLREALDNLKAQLDRLFTVEGRKCFRDPWQARDAYIDVILDRSPETLERLFAAHGQPDLDDAFRRQAFWLLEMQRHGMLMFTSCGWFFDEISGLETTQCLRYAARAMQLAGHFGVELEPEFLATLEKAPSNLPEYGTGRKVWELLIEPSKVDLERVLAHYAITSIYRQPESKATLYRYELETLDQEVRGRGNAHLALGRLHVRSLLTGDEAETNFVVIHYGGLDFHCVLRLARPAQEYADFKRELFDLFETGSLADVTTLVARAFEGRVHRLDDLFVEERRRIIGIVLQERFADYQRLFEQLADQDAGMLRMLARLGYPIPRALWAAASVGLNQRLGKELQHLDGDLQLQRVRKLLDDGRVWGFQPDREAFSRLLMDELEGVLSELNPAADVGALVEEALRILDAVRLLGLHPDLWRAQNQLLDAGAGLKSNGPLEPAQEQVLTKLAARLKISENLLGWQP